MLHADAEEVAVACDDNDVEVLARHLHAEGEREGASVDAVEAVGLLALVQVDEVAGAADAGDDDVVAHRNLALDVPVAHGELESTPDAEVAAAGAPEEVVLGVLGRSCHAFTACGCPAPARRALIRSPSSVGRNGKPVYCVMASALTPWERRTLANCPW